MAAVLTMTDVVTGVILLILAIALVLFCFTYLRLDKFRFHANRIWDHLGEELIAWAEEVRSQSIGPVSSGLILRMKSDCSQETVSNIIHEISSHAGPFRTDSARWDTLVEMTGSLTTTIELYNTDVKKMNKSLAAGPGKLVGRIMKIAQMPLLDLDLTYIYDFKKRNAASDQQDFMGAAH